MKNAFSTNIVFVLFIILGCCLVPFLSVKMAPSQYSNNMTISYQWRGALAEIVEREVTSKLEGLAATLKGVEEIRSYSLKDRGWINVKMNKYTDIQMAKFELNSLIRSSFKKLPKNVSLPIVYGGGREFHQNYAPILRYTLVGNGSSYHIQKFAENFFQESLSNIDGVYSIEFKGATPYELELRYDQNQLTNNKLTVSDIRSAILDYLGKNELGNGIEKDLQGNTNTLFLELRGNEGSTINWNKIPVKKINNKIIYLGELVQSQLKEQEKNYYSRVNGLNTIEMIIAADEKVNQIKLAQLVKEKVTDLEQKLPKGFSLLLVRDHTEYLSKEIQKISYRILLSLVLLLVFVFLINRNWRYLFIVLFSLIANLCIAFIAYYFLEIELHSYSLAGITVSFGILVDNTILMIDHLRHKKNKKVFLAVLAATLTTIGSLAVIFFLDDNLKKNLIDFALVIIINLIASLAVAYFLVPALLDRLPLKTKHSKLFFRRKKRILKINTGYLKTINFLLRFKKSFVTLAILGFGIPFFWLPTSLKGELWYHKLYNTTLGSEVYNEYLRPSIDIGFGGALRLFTHSDIGNHYDPSQRQRTQLNITIDMPDGSVVKQTNIVAEKVENYLAKYNEVEKYFTSIYSAENARIEVLFKEEFDQGSFPYILQNELIGLANTIGGCDMSVQGVGQGFSNKIGEQKGNCTIDITGYNYESVLNYARKTKKELAKQQRVQKIWINSSKRGYYSKRRHEYVMSLNKEELAKNNTTSHALLANLKSLTLHEEKVTTTHFHEDYIPVILRSNASHKSDIWALNNHLSGRIKLKEVGSLTKEASEGTIEKRNQQYKVGVEYEFIGNYSLSNRVLTKMIDTLNVQLPLGFKAERQNRGYWNPEEKSQYGLVLLVMLIVYFICAILLESLLQPLAIILIIPLSFIGIFLTYSLFEIKFDQGGYASFIMICGLVVNSALYIINDYNNNCRVSKNLVKKQLYLKAYNAKIIPIVFTIVSTALGLLPFLITGTDEPFWFSLAAGTIGGLVFSIPAVILYLPLFLFWRDKNSPEIQKKIIT